MAKFSSLFSGSKANCTYISCGGTEILVDAGASASRIKNSLAEIGTDIANISAVFVTHAHSDHIGGLKVLTKNHDIPIYASELTLDELIKADAVSPATKLFPVYGEETVGDILSIAFPTSHDSPGSQGYSFILPNGSKVSVCTDLGYVSDEVREAIYGSSALLFESNHDLMMLKNGPYPLELKLRIGSDKGHLSNNACAAELPGLLEGGTTRFILGHLSLNNNTPMIAKSASVASLMNSGAKEGSDYILYTAPPIGGKVEYI